MDIRPNELSVRKKEAGGGVAAEVSQHPTENPKHRARSRVVILLHGYNNSLEGARKSYDDYLKEMGARWPQWQWLVRDCFGYFWPGDKNWGPLRFASYSLEIRPAKESAKVLYNYLLDLAGPNGTEVQLFLVAHSLGNRVLLELLMEFPGQTPSRVRLSGVCLMAAAVPVKMAKPGGKLHDAVHYARTRGRSLNMFSKKDKVLKWAFPIGETLAFEGFFPKAIGREGEPPGVWTSRVDMQPNNHSHYWAGKRTAEVVGEFLAQGIPPEVSPAEIETNEPPEENEIGAREMEKRSLLERRTFG